MTLPANIRVATQVPFPSQVKGQGVIGIAKANGVWTVTFDLAPLLPGVTAVPNPSTTYALAYDSATGVYYLVQLAAISTNRNVRTLIDAGPYAALPDDDVLIVKPAVAAPYDVTVDWSARSKPLTVVDGKHNAATNNVSITPGAGQTQMGQVDYVYVIDGNGGTITLTPLPDKTGAY